MLCRVHSIAQYIVECIVKCKVYCILHCIEQYIVYGSVVQMTKSCLIDTLTASPAPYSFTVQAGHLVLRVSLVGDAEALRACIR